MSACLLCRCALLRALWGLDVVLRLCTPGQKRTPVRPRARVSPELQTAPENAHAGQARPRSAPSALPACVQAGRCCAQAGGVARPGRLPPGRRAPGVAVHARAQAGARRHRQPPAPRAVWRQGCAPVSAPSHTCTTLLARGFQQSRPVESAGVMITYAVMRKEAWGFIWGGHRK
jgi:hypothetical protein